jgi:hypothetical protein
VLSSEGCYRLVGLQERRCVLAEGATLIALPQLLERVTLLVPAPRHHRRHAIHESGQLLADGPLLIRLRATGCSEVRSAALIVGLTLLTSVNLRRQSNRCSNSAQVAADFVQAHRDPLSRREVTIGDD